MQVKSSFSLYAYGLLVVAIILATSIYRMSHSPIISLDSMGAYLYLPAYFYDDIAHLSKLAAWKATYYPKGNYPLIYLPNDIVFIPQYLGQALLFLPFFEVAHIWAKVGNYPADGFSFPYQMMMTFAGVFYACLGLWLIRLLLKRYFEDKPVAITLLILGLSSPFLFIAVTQPLSANLYLLGLYAFMLYVVAQWHEKPTIIKTLFFSLFSGIAILIHPIHLLSLLILWTWRLSSLNKWKEWFHLLFVKQLPHFFVWLGVVLLLFSLQLFYWKSITNTWFCFNLIKTTLPSYCFWAMRNYLPILGIALLSFATFKKYKPTLWLGNVIALAFSLIICLFHVKMQVPILLWLTLPIASIFSYETENRVTKWLVFSFVCLGILGNIWSLLLSW